VGQILETLHPLNQETAEDDDDDEDEDEKDGRKTLSYAPTSLRPHVPTSFSSRPDDPSVDGTPPDV
jgi:hypothetical protein